MSSSISRDPLSGVIRQNEKVVGAICLPEQDMQDFIDQFNHCYGPLRLHIDAPERSSRNRSVLAPVGASRLKPFRQPTTISTQGTLVPPGKK